jgi:hypothetical protein
MKKGFSDELLFESLRIKARNQFWTLAYDLQTNIHQAITSHLAAIVLDLDILRNENAAVEGERYPEFRRRLGLELRRVRDQMRDLSAS